MTDIYAIFVWANTGRGQNTSQFTFPGVLRSDAAPNLTPPSGGRTLRGRHRESSAGPPADGFPPSRLSAAGWPRADSEGRALELLPFSSGTNDISPELARMPPDVFSGRARACDRFAT